MRLIGVYRDTIHCNDGRQLHKEIMGDAGMLWLYNKVVSNPHPLYSPPKEKSGNHFFTAVCCRIVEGKKP